MADFITLLSGSAVAWPLVARAQTATGRPLIGILLPQFAATTARNMEAMPGALRELGYVEAATLARIPLRGWSDGALPALAAEMVALKPKCHRRWVGPGHSRRSRKSRLAWRRALRDREGMSLEFGCSAELTNADRQAD